MSASLPNGALLAIAATYGPLFRLPLSPTPSQRLLPQMLTACWSVTSCRWCPAGLA